MNTLTDAVNDQAILRAALRHDFGTFVAKVFLTAAPAKRYLPNWHIDAVVYSLALVHRGQIRRLIINQPPRSLKSICTSVAFVAWSIGHDPGKRFACVSYSNEVAATFARQFRLVVMSDWYRKLFPSVRFCKDTETECETTMGGGRFAVPLGGSFTGRGADTIIIDDPLNSTDAQSEKARRFVNDWYATTLLSRLDNKRKGALILVAQRLHEDDLAGTLLIEGGWYHLNLPAIAQHDEKIPIGHGAFHYRKAGDALHPAFEPLEILEAQKRNMGSLQFAAQYQQQPVPAEGNLVKRKWIRSYAAAPSREAGGEIIQSWDVASSVADTSDWSVCSTWRKVKRDYYVLDVWRGRLEFPDLRRKLVALARQHSPNRILIEQSGPGLHHIQELRANPVLGVPMPIGIKSEIDKRARMEAQCARFETGQVFLPKEAPWLDVFLHELLAFPHSRHDDQIDSVSQFLRWAESEHGRWEMDIPSAPIIIYG